MKNRLLYRKHLETKTRAQKKPAQIKKNDYRATQDVKVQEGTTEGKCVAGPCLTRDQVKKTDKLHPLKVKCRKVYHRRS